MNAQRDWTHGESQQRSELLETYIANEFQLWTSVCHHAKMLTALIDRAAKQLSKERADWHDDPTAENHAEHHAPAIEQFPLWVRERTVLSMIRDRMAEERRQQAEKGGAA